MLVSIGTCRRLITWKAPRRTLRELVPDRTGVVASDVRFVRLVFLQPLATESP
jgi:hypothetical protein